MDDCGCGSELNLVSSKVYPDLERAPGKHDNWVEDVGGLPSYIERIAKHIHYEGKEQIGHAIASAVNTVKRWCAGGTVSKTAGPEGSGGVSAATKTKACAALAEWNAKKAAAHASLGWSEADLCLAYGEQLQGEWLHLSSFTQKLNPLRWRRELAMARDRAGLPAEDFVSLSAESLGDWAEAEHKLNLGVSRPITFDWDPNEHPRGLLGRFVDALNSGDDVHLPGGVSVTRGTGLDGETTLDIHHPDGSVLRQEDTGLGSVEDAAKEALNVSAKSNKPGSLGGAKGHTDFEKAQTRHTSLDSVDDWEGFVGEYADAANIPRGSAGHDELLDAGPQGVSGDQRDDMDSFAAELEKSDAKKPEPDKYDDSWAGPDATAEQAVDGLREEYSYGLHKGLYEGVEGYLDIYADPDYAGETPFSAQLSYEHGKSPQFTDDGGLKGNGWELSRQEVIDHLDEPNPEEQTFPDEGHEGDSREQAMDALIADEGGDPTGMSLEEKAASLEKEGYTAEDVDDAEEAIKADIPDAEDKAALDELNSGGGFDPKKRYLYTYASGHEMSTDVRTGQEFVDDGDLTPEEIASGQTEDGAVTALEPDTQFVVTYPDGHELVTSQYASAEEVKKAEEVTDEDIEAGYAGDGELAIYEVPKGSDGGIEGDGGEDPAADMKDGSTEYSTNDLIREVMDEKNAPERREYALDALMESGDFDLVGENGDTLVDSNDNEIGKLPASVADSRLQEDTDDLSQFDGVGTKEDPLQVGDDVESAAKGLEQGLHVQLEQPHQVSTLLDELGKRAAEMIDKGEEAPNFNLCQVQVPGTNLFCVKNKGINRVDMPQLKGDAPTSGSKADLLPRDARGEVDLAKQFELHLTKDLGVGVEDTTERADFLHSTQNELNGAKVAGIAKALDGGVKIEGALFVSSDNYVVDGHHRWAAIVGQDAKDGVLGDEQVEIKRIDMPITEILGEANDFATEWGLPPKAAKGDDGATPQVTATDIEGEFGKYSMTDNAELSTSDGSFGLYNDDDDDEFEGTQNPDGSWDVKWLSTHPGGGGGGAVEPEWKDSKVIATAHADNIQEAVRKLDDNEWDTNPGASMAKAASARKTGKQEDDDYGQFETKETYVSAATEWLENEVDAMVDPDAMDPETLDAYEETGDPGSVEVPQDYLEMAGEILRDQLVAPNTDEKGPKVELISEEGRGGVRLPDGTEITVDSMGKISVGDRTHKVGDVVRHKDSEEHPNQAARVVHVRDDGSVDVVGAGPEGVGNERTNANPADLVPSTSKLPKHVAAVAKTEASDSKKGIQTKSQVEAAYHGSPLPSTTRVLDIDGGLLELEDKNSDDSYQLFQQKDGTWAVERTGPKDDYEQAFATQSAASLDELLANIADDRGWVYDKNHPANTRPRTPKRPPGSFNKQ